MKYLSVCSGIEAATVAWHPLGWEPVALAEIEPFPAAVLKHHYPNVPNLGDMTKIKGEQYRGTVDVLVGGTPCQAFSVAGLRRGLIDPRGSLTLTFAKLADDMAVPFVVWENVPGVLSSKDNAFGCLLGLLAGEADALVAPGGKWTDAGFVLGPQRAIAWRVHDAQYHGLAQRRRRVFVVACPRGGADPREILFEREGLRRDTPPSREAGQGFAHDVAPCIGASGRGFERGGDTRGQDPVVAFRDPCPTITNKMQGSSGWAPYNEDAHLVGVFQQSSMKGKGTIGWEESGAAKPVKTQQDGQMVCVTGPITHALKAEGFDASEDGTGRGNPIVCQQVADTLTNCFHKHHGASGGKDALPRNHVVQQYLGNAEGGCPDVPFITSSSQCRCVNNQTPLVGAHPALNQSAKRSGGVGCSNQELFGQQGAYLVPGVVGSLSCNTGPGGTATCAMAVRTANTGANGHGVSEEMAHTLDRAQGQAVMTLAIRGRGEESNLEIREDGTANALLTPNGGRGGIGVGAVAFHENQRAEVTLNDTAGSLKVGGGKPGQGYPAVAFTRQESETLLGQGIKQGGSDARPQEAYPGKILRALRQEVGEEAFAQWGLGVLNSFLQEEVLRQAVHGCGLRLPARSRDWLVYNALSREEDHAERALLTLREAGCEGRASQGWRPSEQLLRELGAYLSKLSQPGASAAQVVRDLWAAAEGPGLLREALSTIQEVGRPAYREGQPVLAMQVRRLTCEECEFLQGFPRGYTRIPWKNKPAEVCPDGPRYKALGNSMAVPCMRWIGRRIAMVAARQCPANHIGLLPGGIHRES